MTSVVDREAESAENLRLVSLTLDVAMALNARGSLSQTLQRCAEAIVTHLDAAFARIWILNAAENILELAASAGLYTNVDGPHSRVPLGQYKIGMIAQKRRPYVTNLVLGDPLINDQAWAEREGIVAFAGYPLLADDQVVGVMALFSRQLLDGTAGDVLASLAPGIAQFIRRLDAEAALAREEYFLHALMDNIPDSIYFKDGQSRFIRLNPGAVRKLGATCAEEALSKTDADFFTEEHARHALEDEQLIMETGCSLIGLEEKETWRDRPGAWVSTTKLPLYDDSGRIMGTFGISRDITDRKRAEAAMRAKVAALQTMSEIDREILAAIEPQGILDLVCRHAAGLLHAPKSLIVLTGPGQAGDMMSHYGVADPAGARRELTEHWSREQVYPAPVSRSGPTTITGRPSGGRLMSAFAEHEGIHAMTSAALVIGGETVGALLVFDTVPRPWTVDDLEIVSMLAAEASLALDKVRLYKAAESRAQQLATLNEISRAITSTLDLDQVLVMLLERVRQAAAAEACSVALIDRTTGNLVFRQAIGAAGPDIVGLQLAPGEGVAGWVAAHRQSALVRRVSADRRFSNRVDDQTGFITRDLVCVPFVVHDTVVGVMEALNKRDGEFQQEDVQLLESVAAQAAVAIENARLYSELQEERSSLAERVAKRTAELSVANAELAKAARLKDEFLANMSHELRTPLNAIFAFTESMQEGIYGPLTPKQEYALGTIAESGRHLLALINDILDLSKIEANKLDLSLDTMDVAEVCRASLAFIKQPASQKRISVTQALDSQVETIQGDERRIKQILVNLLSNAVKFTPAGRCIGLEVAGDVEEQVVHFTVWDTGIGIPAEQVPRLFQPFVQLDSSLARQYEGTGLGLALVRRLTEAHGGSITLASEVGQGSRFTVSLPWCPIQEPGSPAGAGDPAAAPPPGTPGSMQGNQKPGTALVAEDNESNLVTLVDYLTYQGYRVIPARNGQEAIERALEHRPEVILMDCQMPSMDGLEATKRIRALPELAGTCIIALTALAMPGDRERCLAAGANAYLSKPISLKRLRATIAAQRSSPV
jgi:PAS domain S-box-containing protein